MGYLWMNVLLLDECVIYGWMCHFWMNVLFLDEYAIFGWMCHLWMNMPFLDECATFGWMCHLRMNMLLLDECAIYGWIYHFWMNVLKAIHLIRLTIACLESNHFVKKVKEARPGLEPATNRSEGQRANLYTTDTWQHVRQIFVCLNYMYMYVYINRSRSRFSSVRVQFFEFWGFPDLMRFL